MRDAMTCKDDVTRFLSLAGPDDIFCSPKLDGVRVMAVVAPDGSVAYVSRNKKLFPNFSRFDEPLVKLSRYFKKLVPMSPDAPVVFDGEMIAKDKTFSDVMSQLRRLKDVDASIFEFNLFDVWMPNTPLAHRLKLLGTAVSYARGVLFCDGVTFLRHSPVKVRNEAEVKALCDHAVEMGFEGIVLKTKSGVYEHKRSALWCKVKQFETVDLQVIGMEPGTGKHEGRLGALICLFNGKNVRVGTGFSDEQREEFMRELPRIVEVGCQEKTSGGSLRFPVFMRVREDKDETN